MGRSSIPIGDALEMLTKSAFGAGAKQSSTLLADQSRRIGELEGALIAALGYLHWFEGETSEHQTGRKSVEAQILTALKAEEGNG